MSLNREDKELNKDLEAYKENLKKKGSISEFFQEEMINSKERCALKAKFIKENEKVSINDDAGCLIELGKGGIRSLNPGMLGRGRKLINEFKLEEIRSIDIKLGTALMSRGFGVFPAWDYEDKKEEALELLLIALEVKIEKVNGESKVFSIGNVRNAIPVFMEWARENSVKIIDKEEVVSLVKETEKGGLYNYYKNHTKEKDFGFRIQSKMFGD